MSTYGCQAIAMMGSGYFSLFSVSTTDESCLHSLVDCAFAKDVWLASVGNHVSL